MLRLAVKLVLAAAAVVAVWSFVPVGGRTMAARWQRAGSPAALLEGLRADLGHEPSRPAAHHAPGAQARSGAAPGRPTESHSEADRQALDRIVSRHLEKR
jgi:hypothetical protein